MLTLGIETSCDETSCAVLDGYHDIRSNIVSSSLFRHKDFGGIVPEIASRHCLEQIDFVCDQALRKAGVQAGDLNLVAVTKGPGLIGSLLVGVSFAKALSFRLGIPLVGVNHLEAHLSANFIGREEPSNYIGLLVSGGHTSITHHQKGDVRVLGTTVDDAVGEAFDKVAKIMGLGFPGGPIIDRMAREGNGEVFKFTKPKQKNRFDFSYSGIKTAVLYEVQRQTGVKSSKQKSGKAPARKKKLSKKFLADMCASFQNAAIGWLVDKALDAAAEEKVRDIVVGGGVSANSRLREGLRQAAEGRGIDVWFPPLFLTGDNAAMIARKGVELYDQGVRSSWTMAGNPNLEVGAGLSG